MRHGMMGVAEPESPITGYDDLGDIHQGDLQQGSGVSTPQLGRVTVSPFGSDRGRKSDMLDIAGKSSVQNLLDNVTGKKSSGGSLGVVLVAIVLLVLVKFVTEKNGEEREFSTVRIGLENLFITGTMALLWFYVVTIIAAMWPGDGPIISNFREFVSIAK